MESQQRFAEIRLRACVRIGELSRELETAKNQYDARPNGRTSKSEALSKAGISRSTANDYEQLVGGKEKQAQAIAAEGKKSEARLASKSLLGQMQTFAKKHLSICYPLPGSRPNGVDPECEVMAIPRRG